jgi:hypothetical protein
MSLFGGLLNFGSDTQQNINDNMTVVNNMLQLSKGSCTFGCSNILNNVTFIIIGGSGDVTVSQECKMKGLTCILQQSLDSQTQNILKSMLNQSSFATNGFSLDWTKVSQNVDLSQLIQNSITQTMESSCTFTASNDASNLYFYVQDHKGNVGISQSADITNSTCNMNNAAKAVTYNSETSDVTQKSTIINILAILFIIIIIAIVIAGIVLAIFLFTGGVKTVAGAVGKAGGSGGSIIRNNPELMF